MISQSVIDQNSLKTKLVYIRERNGKQMETQQNNYGKEKLLNPFSGVAALILLLLAILGTTFVFVMGIIMTNVFMIVGGSIIFSVAVIMLSGLKVISPNEAAVYLLFGNYYGTISKPGFFYINPFCNIFNPSVQPFGSVTVTSNGTSIPMPPGKKVSTKAVTLNNEKQKVNDNDGNPIEIGVIVIYRVVNATKAVFEVDNYAQYVSTQSDASIRQVARQFPYDISGDEDEFSLRGSSTEVAEVLKKDLQGRVDFAGIEILEARIAHLAYAQEIAAAMLQRQQAKAIIDARQQIVEGAVGMVKMALTQLENDGLVELDEERKAAMVSNLLVVLCANKDTQPVVNSGSIY